MGHIPSEYWDKFLAESRDEDGGAEGLGRTMRIFGQSIEAQLLAKQRWPIPPANPLNAALKCGKVLSCGHPCNDLAWRKIDPCTRCAVPIQVTRECGHTTWIYCSSAPPVTTCNRVCKRKLACGHPCRNECEAPCETECRDPGCWEFQFDRNNSFSSSIPSRNRFRNRNLN